MKTQNQSKNWAIVTGASSGIGESFARQLAEQGYNVLLVARREDRLRALCESISKTVGVQAEFRVCDLSVLGRSKALIESLADGRTYEVLINNAGMGKFSEFKDTSYDEQKRMIDLNVMGLVEMTHAFVRKSIAEKVRSKIMNVGSIGAYSPTGHFAVYTASKAFVRLFSLALRHELAPFGIGVTLLNPGGTVTEFTQVSGQNVKKAGQLAMMSSDRCVQIAIKGLMKNRAVVIPGFINQVSCFFSKIIPERFIAPISTLTMLMAVDTNSPKASSDLRTR